MRYMSCFYVINLANKFIIRRNPASTRMLVPQYSLLNAGRLKNLGLLVLFTVTLTFTVTPLSHAKDDLRTDNNVSTADNIENNIDKVGEVFNTFQNMPPVAVCKNIVVQLGSDGTVSITGPDVDGGSFDPDGTIVSRVVIPSTFTCSEIGANIVTLTVTDDGGLFSTCVATVTVEDNIPPAMVCRDLTLYLDQTGAAMLLPADVNNGSSDNCPGALSLFLSRISFSCSDIGAPVPVTLTGTDASGNSADCISQVTVLDTISPTVNVKTFNLVLGTSGTGTLLPSDIDNGTFDNCGPVSLSVNPNTFSCGDLGTNIVSLTAIDNFGNSSSQNVAVTVSSTLEITSMSLNNCDLVLPYSIYRAEIEGGDGNYSYFWDGLEDYVNPFLEIIPVPPYLLFTNTSTSETPFFNNTMADGIYTIRLIVTDGNGCIDTSEMKINFAGPVFNNITQVFSNACEGEVAVYSVKYDTAAAYSWVVENGTILTADPDTNIIDVQWNIGIILGVVNTTITKPNMLGDPCVFYLIDTVTINPVPVPAFDNPAISACSNSEYTYTLSSSFASYNWTVTGGNITGGGTIEVNYVKVRWGTGPSGRVTVEVENGFECTGSVFIDVNINNLGGSVISLTNISCNGASDGQVTVSATSGSGQPPYEYSLDGGAYQASGTFTNISLGNHTVRIRDGLLCTFDVFFTITQPPVLTGNVSSQTDVSCYGGTDGSVTIYASGGVNPYEYRLDAGPFQTSNIFTGLSAGSYSVTIRDNNNCLRNVPVMITQPFAPLAGLTVVANVLCFGEATGAIDLTVTGGTPPYTFLWSNGAGTEDLINLTAGTYTVTITDANSCTTTAGGTVTQPAAPLAGTTVMTDVLCFGDATGAIDLTVTGGTAPYTFLWSNGATTEDLINIAAGTYTVTITDANSCVTTAGGTITQPAAALAGTAVVKDVSCFGGNDGAVDLTVTGGTSPYTFLWSNGATTEDIIDLTAGTYTVVITDANSCTTTAGGTVTQPAVPLAGTTIVTDVLCYDDATGAIDLTVTGGTAPYTFLWSNGATTEDITDLTAGTYTVVITDANSCTTTAGGTVTQPAAALAGMAVMTDVNCFGGNDGAVDLTVTGGTAPYTFLWSNGATTEDIIDLTAGTYTVTITDVNSCTTTSGGTVTQPAAPLAGTTVVTDVLCYGDATGTIDLTVTGGTAPYTFLWSDGSTNEDLSDVIAGTYTVTIADANNCTTNAAGIVTEPLTALEGSIISQINVTAYGGNDGSVTVEGSGGTPPYQYKLDAGAYQISGSFGSLMAGTYIVTVQDNNLCIFEVPVTITQPPAELSGSVISQTNVSCFGGNDGNATVEGAGGYPPYEYSFNGGPYQSSGTFTALIAGTYTVTVRDAVLDLYIVPVIITEPTELTVTTTRVDVLCMGEATGSATAIVSGGTEPYSYSWNTLPVQTSATATGLTAGLFTVTVTDANGCIATADATITQPATALTVTTTWINVLCYGDTDGSATATAEGGIEPYTYSWNTSPEQTDPSVSGLAAGNYTVTVTDFNGCTATGSAQITEPAEIVVLADVTDAACPNEANGSITLTIAGGLPPYAVKWDDDDEIITPGRINLLPGTYSVVVTDQNGCAQAQSVDVGYLGTFNCVEIPQIITPNNDGYNDEWIMRNIDIYPNAEVLVFNRWGKLIFRTKNIPANPWDGRFEGRLVPTDSYHYILYLNDGSEPRSGVISVIR
jgi:gliding motility-associated-like protein